MGDEVRESPSRRKISASSESHRRAALSATVSNTGWMSVGELEITRRISLVAVCCSSASVRSAFLACELAEQPRVLDGDHGLVGERLEQRDLGGREATDLVPVTPMTPTTSSPRSIGTVDDRAEAACPGVRRGTAGPQDGSVSTSATCCTVRVRTARPGG